jgi:hypothetical protein
MERVMGHTSGRTGRLLAAHRLALHLYGVALAEEDCHAPRVGLLGLLLATVWLAAERGAADPWRRLVKDDRVVEMTRTDFLKWAAAAWDGWATERPDFQLVVLKGSKP